jgi:hypothetical protein
MALENRQLLMIEVVVFAAAWFAIATVFWRPRLDALAPRRALRAIVAPQMFRFVGLSLLATNFTRPELDADFARGVAIGDCATAALAFASFVALGRPGRLGVTLAAITTVVGTLDIVRNLAMGTRVNAALYIGGGWLVVAVAVPLMIVAHVGAARMLLRRDVWNPARCGDAA